jgi:lauroyl/myristoyl acyltransferase
MGSIECKNPLELLELICGKIRVSFSPKKINSVRFVINSISALKGARLNRISVLLIREVLYLAARLLPIRLVYSAVDFFYARPKFLLGDYEAYMRNVSYYFQGLRDDEARHLCRDLLINRYKTSIEFYFCGRLPKKKLERMVIPVGLGNIDKGLALGHGVIFFSMHSESVPIPFYLAGRGYPINVAIWEKTASFTQYLWGNQIKGVSSFEEMKRCLNRNEILFVFIDGLQGKRPVEVNFLGKKTLFSPGTIVLARETGAAAIPFVGMRQRDGKLKFVVHKKIDLDLSGLENSNRIKEEMQKCVDSLEPYVIENPSRYFYLFLIERKIKYFQD